MIERRPFEKLGKSNHGWLNANFHFSFAEYRDPFHQLGQLLEVIVQRPIEFGAMRERHNLTRLARMEIAQIVQLPDVLIALAGDGRLRNREQFVGRLAHCGDNHDGLEFHTRFYDGGDTLDGGCGFDGSPAEFHDDHQSSSPSECINSAFNTAAPAAPRIVL